MQTSESSDRIKAIIISIIVHTLILLLAFLLVFKPPNPPLDSLVMGGGSGVELNFGTDDVGSGDVQTYNNGGENATEDPSKGEQANNEETTEENEEVTKENTPVEQNVDKTITSDDKESPVEVPPVDDKKKKVEKKEVVVKEPVKKTEAKKEDPKPVVNDKALFKKNTGSGGKTDGSGKQQSGSNEGDDVGKTGNKGKPDGDLNGRAYFGKKGSGGDGNGGNGSGTGSGDGNGASMNVPGWKWVARPNPKDNSDATGTIIFTVKIDDEGKVLSCIRKGGTVTDAAVIEVYKKAIMEDTDFQSDHDGTPAPVSTGVITFIIKAK